MTKIRKGSKLASLYMTAYNKTGKYIIVIEFPGKNFDVFRMKNIGDALGFLTQQSETGRTIHINNAMKKILDEDARIP